MIGVDEVGRGCWAGPLLVIAAYQKGDLPAGITDSKLLSRQKRLQLFEQLEPSCQFGEGWVSSLEIDALGLTEALRAGVARALAAIGAQAEDEIILDGNTNYAPPAFTRVNCLINADVSVPLVSAASIFAKVKRDRYMAGIAKKHPLYGFDKNVGYGTAVHQTALLKHGLIEGIHRKSYKPIKKIIKVYGD